MQDDLSTLVCAHAMLLFREQGLRFTMQQVAQQLHISKKTIYRLSFQRKTFDGYGGPRI